VLNHLIYSFSPSIEFGISPEYRHHIYLCKFRILNTVRHATAQFLSVWLPAPARLGPPYASTLSELLFDCQHTGDASYINGCKTNHFVAIWLHPVVRRKLPYAVSQYHRSLRI
jgi:hypothetical protein